jgi:glycosyltransferase involved in cell wall biosynthesis
MKRKNCSNPHTLYLCYFWLNESLVQTQVLPYLRELVKGGIRVSLLTFERDELSLNYITEQRENLKSEGIEWYFLKYHKRPSVPATLYDVVQGVLLANKIAQRENVNIFHARVHVPALMGAIVKTLHQNRIKLVFDIRGFMPEEYTDGGNWKPNGRLYHSVKQVEKWLLKKSDAFVVLTEKAREILFPESAVTGFDRFNRPVEVIPCCVDLKKFQTANDAARREIRGKYNLGNRRVIVYVGSLGTWYLADEMADFFAVAREENPATFALVLTQNAPEIFAEKLAARGFAPDDFLITRVAPSEIPQFLSAADIALSFIKPCFSKLSSSPTKIAEYLASGLPVVTNRGVGDVAEQIEADQTGAVVADFSRESYLTALREIENLRRKTDLSAACRASAAERFDLERVGGAKYRRLYQKLTDIEQN